MTTYTAIPDSALDADSPITTTIMTRLRDNAIAMAEGHPTAPAGDAPCKAWVYFSVTGAVQDSYNVSSVTDLGTGWYKPTWSASFANDDYCVLSMANLSVAANTPIMRTHTRNVAYAEVRTAQINTAGTLIDTFAQVAAWGTLA